jgi:hypothetical protein
LATDTQLHFRNFTRTSEASLFLPESAGERFVPNGPVVIGMDDTIERRWGQRIAARGIYRDPVRSIDQYIGLDVSLKQTAISIRKDGKRIWRVSALRIQRCSRE